MNIEVQSKLLRVLQENEIQKVGSEKSIKINCRVVAATNRNLKDEIKKGTFREDLYYRLNLIKIDLPSLKNRNDDLFELTAFLRLFLLYFKFLFTIIHPNVSLLLCNWIKIFTFSQLVIFNQPTKN